MAESLPLQAFQYVMGGDVRIVLASGRVFIFPKIPAHQFFSSFCADGHGVSGSHNQNDWLVAHISPLSVVKDFTGVINEKHVSRRAWPDG